MSYRDLFMQDNAEAMEKFQLAVERIEQIQIEKVYQINIRTFSIKVQNLF